MGGVFPVNKAQKVFFGGVSDFPPEKVFNAGEMIWERPFGSVSPARLADTDDNILLVGSSDMGCVIGATWSPHGSSDWHTTFRSDYTGSDTPLVESLNQAGINMAVTYGRVDIDTIMTNAENGQYGIANPLTHMGNYDILVMDTSDVMYPNETATYPEAPIDLFRTQMARPYSWTGNPGHQEWLNNELRHKMRLIRLANAQGVKQFWLTSPWPRLPRMDGILTLPEIIEWEGYAYDSIRASMEWQQDRLNEQCLNEQLGITVKLIPFDILFKRFGEDIRAGNVPEMTDMRQIRANGNNSDAVNPVDGFTATNKHWYMLNYKGNYLINCLFSWLVHGDDPRGKPRTDARYTLSVELATYFQNLAYSVGSTYPRGGRTVVADPLTNRMPKMRNISAISEIPSIASKLVLNQSDVVAGTTYNFAGGTQQIPFGLFLMEADPAQGDWTTDAMTHIFDLLGSGAYRTEFHYNNVSGWMTFTTYDTSYTGSALTFGPLRIRQSDGMQRIILETRMHVIGTHPLPLRGSRQQLYINNGDVDPHAVPSGYFSDGVGANDTDPVSSPTNRFVMQAGTGWTCREAIIAHTVPTPHETYNLHRYLARKHQIPHGVERLWPDLED